jgi:hypothetical protein
MALVSITALVHIEDYGQVGICARDYLDPYTVGFQTEVTILDWDETLMVAIPQNTSDEPF